MRTVFFNNISFESLGLILRKTPVPPCSQPNYEITSIPDGPVIFENTKVREPVKFPIECTLIKEGKLRDIYAMVQERGKLILPDEPDKYYKALLTVSTPKNIILQYNNIVFNAVCDPYAYSVKNEPEVYELASASWYKHADVTNNGTADCEPVYRLKVPGSFDIWNGSYDYSCKFTLSGADEVIIDVQNMIVYNSSGRILLDKMEGNLNDLKLKPGKSQIRITSVTELEITKNERWC